MVMRASQVRGKLRRVGAACIPPYLGLVATGSLIGQQSNGNAAINFRSAHRALVDISQIMVAPTANFSGIGQPESTKGSGSTATVEIGVEYNGVTARITFPSAVQSASNPNIGAVPSGDLILSDLVTIPTIPAGATFFIRQYMLNTGGLFFRGQVASTTGLAGANSGAVGGNQSQGTGAIASENMFANGLSMFPSAVIGYTTRPSVGILGDSKTFGFGTGATVQPDGREGEVLHNFPLDTYAFLNMAHSGLATTTMIAADSATSKLYSYLSHFIIDLGFNDVITNSQTAAATATNMAALIAALPAGKKYTICTVSPSATSSNSFVDSAGQTTDARNPARVSYNGLVRAGSVSGVNNGYLEIADGLETARDSGLWKSTGVANVYTSDGTHPNDTGYGLIGVSGITPAILSNILAYP